MITENSTIKIYLVRIFMSQKQTRPTRIRYSPRQLRWSTVRRLSNGRRSWARRKRRSGNIRFTARRVLNLAKSGTRRQTLLTASSKSASRWNSTHLPYMSLVYKNCKEGQAYFAVFICQRPPSWCMIFLSFSCFKMQYAVRTLTPRRSDSTDAFISGFVVRRASVSFSRNIPLSMRRFS